MTIGYNGIQEGQLPYGSSLKYFAAYKSYKKCGMDLLLHSMGTYRLFWDWNDSIQNGMTTHGIGITALKVEWQ